MNGNITDLVPIRGGISPLSSFPVVAEDPLAVLARELPGHASSIMHRRISAMEIASRTRALTSLSHDHTSMACTWLQNRQPGEQNMAIATGGESSERGIFARGERVRLTTRIAIW